MNYLLFFLGLFGAGGLASVAGSGGPGNGHGAASAKGPSLLANDPDEEDDGLVDDSPETPRDDTDTTGSVTDDDAGMGGDTMDGMGDDTMDGMGDDTMDGMGDDTMDGMGGMDMGGDHADHDVVDIPPPGVGASAGAISDYLDALAALPEDHIHTASASVAGEHMAAIDLVPRGDATHVAIGDGDWNDPGIWANGEVPGDDARVLIPEGVTVEYSGVNDARLFTVRVDGTLDFATDVDSKMIFDTFVVAPSGHLIIGTADDPVDPDVDIDLIVANNGPIDTDWDPMLLSRGLIAHGDTTIHGAVKDSHEKVIEDPMAGDTSVRFAEVPEGWQVGDKVVIAGTHYDGYKYDREANAVIHHESEDEVRFITKIGADGRIWFDEPLEHDHDAPREDLKTSVANYTRNVSIETENGAEAEIYERGHVMFMHNDDVDVRYAEFTELGRTDKSELSKSAEDFDQVDFDTNVQGRYSLHIHKAGVGDMDDPAMLVGNAVFGSPGWGYVHHDSNAILDNNASFDTYGAGFVAETGNETGIWSDNIAIYAQGNSWGTPKDTSMIFGENFDTGRGGDGFWFQGRMVASIDNVAASVNTGYVYFHRGPHGMMEFDADLFDHPDALHFDESVTADDASIRVFSGNETFAAHEGLHVVKSNTEQGHDVHSHLDDFTAWSVVNGAHLEYTSHYVLTNFDLVGKEDALYSIARSGIVMSKNASDITIVDANIESFQTGIDLYKEFITWKETTPDLHSFSVIDATFTDVDQEYAHYDARYDTLVDRDDLSGGEIDLDLDGPLTFADQNITPGASGWVDIDGTKTDGLGDVDFATGLDNYGISGAHLINWLEEEGYYTTSGGDAYALIDLYFTDRLTGDLYAETHPVWIDGSVPLGSSYSKLYANAVDNGVQDIVTKNGVDYAGDVALDTAYLVERAGDAAEEAEDTVSSTKVLEMVASMRAEGETSDIETATTMETTETLPTTESTETSPESDLWTLLTQNQGLAEDVDIPVEPEEEPLALELVP